MEKKDFVKLVTEAIDKLEVQGRACTDRSKACHYLDDLGHCCIVGHMMPDDDVRKSADRAEKSSIMGLYREGFEWLEQFNAQQVDLLDSLQEVHDDPHMPFEEKLNEMQDILDEYKRG